MRFQRKFSWSLGPKTRIIIASFIRKSKNKMRLVRINLNS